jgi:Protein of unknown function (DUF3768)
MARSVCHLAKGHDRHCPQASMGVLAAAAEGDAVMSTDRIRELNDAFRRTFRGGKVMMTASVDALPDMVKCAALHEVATFSEFNEDNDPHREHDFGSFELCSRTFFWKIEYFDKQLRFGSENPGDPEKTARVLTLMLAEDY